MIKKTRLKIIIVTMAILVAVFIAVGAVTFALMMNRPRQYPFQSRPGGLPMPNAPEFNDAIKEVESQLAGEWVLSYSIFAGAGLAGLFIVVCFLSGWIVKPVKNTIEKQKQFVSDASHELKTPISIISASADVLTANDADNKWLQNIKAQTERMKLLTNDLLTLTRIDENAAIIAEKFNLSEVITETVLPFESIVYEAGKSLTSDIAADIHYIGSKEEIITAVNILTDNAVKYSDDGGTVRISLFKQGNKAVLEVFNTGPGINETEKVKVFDRFYRSDFSRTRETGGSGLGLSILKNLAEKRGWKLAVNSDEKKGVTFVIQF